VLVNNAGISARSKFDEPGAREAWDRVMSVNLQGVFNVTQAFVPALKRTQGSIVNLSSIVAFGAGISRHPPGEPADLHARPATPEALLMRDTLAPDLQAAIDDLPPQFREAVWLRDVEEFSYAEIADMLAIPVGTVMSRISRGRRMLFDRLSALRPVAMAAKT